MIALHRIDKDQFIGAIGSEITCEDRIIMNYHNMNILCINAWCSFWTIYLKMTTSIFPNIHNLWRSLTMINMQSLYPACGKCSDRSFLAFNTWIYNKCPSQIMTDPICNWLLVYQSGKPVNQGAVAACQPPGAFVLLVQFCLWFVIAGPVSSRKRNKFYM